MQDRGILSIRLVIQVLVGLFVISFGGLLVQYGGVFRQNTVEKQEVIGELNLDGVVLSMKNERFLHTKNVLTSLGIKVTQKVPPSYLSKQVDRGLETFVGSRVFHSATFLKVWSNRMAFLDAIGDFVQDSSCTRNTWRFFFEDDIAIHPNMTSERARGLVAKGLKLADKEGFLYLGICGPNCSQPSQTLDEESKLHAVLERVLMRLGFSNGKPGSFSRR